MASPSLDIDAPRLVARPSRHARRPVGGMVQLTQVAEGLTWPSHPPYLPDMDRRRFLLTSPADLRGAPEGILAREGNGCRF